MEKLAVALITVALPAASYFIHREMKRHYAIKHQKEVYRVLYTTYRTQMVYAHELVRAFVGVIESPNVHHAIEVMTGTTIDREENGTLRISVAKKQALNSNDIIAMARAASGEEITPEDLHPKYAKGLIQQINDFDVDSRFAKLAKGTPYRIVLKKR